MNEEFDGVEWDKNKNDWNVRHRGFGFEFAAGVFAGAYVETASCNRETGETRFVAIGCVDDLVVTVVWTPRAPNRRIISARPSSRRERRIYHDHRQKGTL